MCTSATTPRTSGGDSSAAPRARPRLTRAGGGPKLLMVSMRSWLLLRRLLLRRRSRGSVRACTLRCRTRLYRGGGLPAARRPLARPLAQPAHGQAPCESLGAR
jgi:hypothetical protein